MRCPPTGSSAFGLPDVFQVTFQVLLVLITAWIVSGTPTLGEEQGGKKYSKGVLIRLENEITRFREQFLYRKLDAARKEGADLVVVEINSPGGYLEESQNMAERLRDINWADTVAYIPEQALSGAAILSLGCDEIIMHPKARMGDAGVIFLDQDYLFKYADEKIRSAVARRVRDLAEAKDRPPALAEAMIDMDLIVYRVRNRETNEEKFMSDDEIKSSDNPDQWEKLNQVLESREKKFLIVNGERALELQLAEGNVTSVQELKARYQLDNDFIIMEHRGVDTAVQILNSPLVTGLLFVIGLVALYIELSAPGISVGGLISGLCFALFFWSRALGGTSGWLEVILFLAGIVFLAMELFVIPGFGVSGITGLLLIFASLVMASQDFGHWNTARQLPSLTTTLAVILGSGIIAIGTIGVLSRYMPRIPVLNRLVLHPPQAGEEQGVDEVTKDSPLQPEGQFPVAIGDWGIADSPLRPAGKAKFGNDYVDVVSEGVFVDNGEHVRVIDISGNRIMVRKVERPA